MSLKQLFARFCAGLAIIIALVVLVALSATTGPAKQKRNQHVRLSVSRYVPDLKNHSRTAAYGGNANYAITFHWSGLSIANQTGYYVFANSVQVSNQTGTTYVDTSVPCNTTVTLGVEAHDSAVPTVNITPIQNQTYTTPACFQPLHVLGNRLIAASGQQVVLHGVDVSGTGYQCERTGGSFTDTNSGDALIQPMVSNNSGALPQNWNVNSVLIGINQDCWLGLYGVPGAYSGTNYISFIQAQVSAAEAYGLYPVLVPAFGSPFSATNYYGTNNGSLSMPNAEHMALLWEELADTFKSDPYVMFRTYEEPYPDFYSGATSLSAWKCWSSGDVQYATTGDQTPPTSPTSSTSVSHCSEDDEEATPVPFNVLGMQSIVNIIRGTGAKNIIQISGLDYANMLSCTTTESPVTCGFLDSTDGVKVNDTLSPPQLMADTDNYPDVGQTCGNLTCWEDTYGVVAESMPVDIGELGVISGTSFPLVEQLTEYYDSIGQSYYASQWENWANLISNNNGTPAVGWGTWYYDHETGATCPVLTGC